MFTSAPNLNLSTVKVIPWYLRPEMHLFLDWRLGRRSKCYSTISVNPPSFALNIITKITVFCSLVMIFLKNRIFYCPERMDLFLILAKEIRNSKAQLEHLSDAFKGSSINSLILFAWIAFLQWTWLWMRDVQNFNSIRISVFRSTLF